MNKNHYGPYSGIIAILLISGRLETKTYYTFIDSYNSTRTAAENESALFSVRVCLSENTCEGEKEWDEIM